MNAPVAHQIFFVRKIEEGTVSEARLPTICRGRPGVEVCIEVNDCDRTVDRVQRS